MLRRLDAFVVPDRPRAADPQNPTPGEVHVWREWLLRRVRLSLGEGVADSSAVDVCAPNRLPLRECDLQEWASDPCTTDELQAELMAMLPLDHQHTVFELTSTEALGYWLLSSDRDGAIEYLNSWGLLGMVVEVLQAQGWCFYQ